MASFVIALVGMAFEARIADGPGVLVLRRCDAERALATLLAEAVRGGCRSIISFGIAGGLAADLRAGDWIIASAVVDSQSVCHTDPAWSRRLLQVVPNARHAPIMGVDVPVVHPAAKQALNKRSGAVAIDMESHMVARLAAAYGLAFAVARVVVDPAHRLVPEAALLGMRPDGSANLAAVLRGLVARPSDVLALARISIDAWAARQELRRVRRLLGPRFGLLDLTRDCETDVATQQSAAANAVRCRGTTAR